MFDVDVQEIIGRLEDTGMRTMTLKVSNECYSELLIMSGKLGVKPGRLVREMLETWTEKNRDKRKSMNNISKYEE